MTKSNSTMGRAKKKPDKPYAGFPLFGHSNGQWAKKVRGKLHYFGPWSDPDGALAKYLEQKDDLHAGRTPRQRPDGLTVRDLVNRFLSAKRHLVDTGELVLRSWSDYHRTCGRVVAVFGKDRLIDDLTTEDFGRLRTALAKTLGPVALGNEIQRTRVLFKWGFDEDLIDKPIRYGQSFKRPSFQTIGNEARDPIVTRHIMGHVESANDMSAVYREAVSDERLRAVTDHVRTWLFGSSVPG